MNDTTKPEKREKVTQAMVREAVVDLHNAEQFATRETLAESLGVTLTIIDDHIGKLIEVGDVYRVKPGIYAPTVKTPPARAITTTHMPWGGVKLELGDDLIELTPREARLMGKALAGHAVDYTSLQSAQETNTYVAQLAQELREAKRATKALQDRVEQLLNPSTQLDLKPA